MPETEADGLRGPVIVWGAPDLYAIGCAVKARAASVAYAGGLDLGIVVAYVAAAAFHQAHWMYWRPRSTVWPYA